MEHQASLTALSLAVEGPGDPLHIQGCWFVSGDGAESLDVHRQ